MSIEEVLADFPDLTNKDIQACFAFTAVGKASPSGESRSTINCYSL